MVSVAPLVLLVDEVAHLSGPVSVLEKQPVNITYYSDIIGRVTTGQNRNTDPKNDPQV